jgi:cell division protease FtsH
MSDVLGPLSYGQKEGEVFLGRDINQSRDFSEVTAQTIDREIRDIVEKNYQRARELLSSRLQTLHDIALTLFEHETLDGEDIERIMNGQKIEKTKPLVRSNTHTGTGTPVATSSGSGEPDRGGAAGGTPVLA